MNYGQFTPEKIYWSSPEVVQLTGVPAHTLRYWEEVIPCLQIPKGRAKKRMYRKQDIDFILALKAELETRGKAETISFIGKKTASKLKEKTQSTLDSSKVVTPETRKPNLQALQNLRSELLDAISRLNNSKKKI